MSDPRVTVRVFADTLGTLQDAITCARRCGAPEDAQVVASPGRIDIGWDVQAIAADAMREGA